MGDFCRSTVSTMWPYHSGRMVRKVVDGDYSVTSVAGLRVI